MDEPETNLDFLDAGVDMHALDDVAPSEAPTVLDRLGPAHFRSKGFSFMGFLQTVYDHVAEQSKRGGPPLPEVIEDPEQAEEPAFSEAPVVPEDEASDLEGAEPESREPSLVEALPAVHGLFGATSIEEASISNDLNAATDFPSEAPPADHVAILSDRLESENAVPVIATVDSEAASIDADSAVTVIEAEPANDFVAIVSDEAAVEVEVEVEVENPVEVASEVSPIEETVASDVEDAPTHIAANAADELEVNAAETDDGSDVIDAEVDPMSDESPRKSDDV